MLPWTTHQSSFMGMQSAGARQDASAIKRRSQGGEAPYPFEENRLFRTASNDAFGMSASLPPLQPRRSFKAMARNNAGAAANPPFFSSKDAGGRLIRSTSSDAFVHYPGAVVRTSAKPLAVTDPFASIEAYSGAGQRVVTSTAKDAFTAHEAHPRTRPQWTKKNRRRGPQNPAPYGF